MSGAGSYIPWEADELERLTKDLPNDENDEVWRVYGQRGFDSAAVVAKQYESRLKVRHKVVGDAIDQAIERLRAAATTAAQTSGDTAIADQITALADHLAPARPVAATTKAYNPATDPLARMLEADQTKR